MGPIISASYTTEALKIQLENEIAWYTENAFSPDYNYSDEERIEMHLSISDLLDEIAKRAIA